MFIAFINNFFEGKAAQVLCHTFIHSLWQGAVAAIAAGIVLLCTRKSSARIRYNLLGIIFMSLFLVCVVTFSLELRSVSATASVPLSSHQSIYINAGHTASSLLQSIMQLSNQYSSGILSVWLILVLYKCSRLAVGLQSLHRFRTKKLKQPPQTWHQKFHELKKKMGVQFTVQLMESFLVKVPVAIGFLKPIILVPVGLLNHLSPKEVEGILIHELAHIRRRDFLVNLLQKLVETIFFFNPAVLWISSLLRNEREACCDDIVLMYSGDCNSYVNALISFNEYAMGSEGLALAIGGDKRALFQRVKRIIIGENKKLNVAEKLLLLTGLLLLSAFTFFPPGKKPDGKNFTIKKQAIQLPDQMRLSSKVNYRTPGTGNTAALQLTRLPRQSKDYDYNFSLEKERDTSGWKFREMPTLFDLKNESSMEFDMPATISSTVNKATITGSSTENQSAKNITPGNSEVKPKPEHSKFDYMLYNDNEMMSNVSSIAIRETLLNTSIETGKYMNSKKFNYSDKKFKLFKQRSDIEKYDWKIKTSPGGNVGSNVGKHNGSDVGLYTGSDAGSSSESQIESQAESTIETDSKTDLKNGQTKEKLWQTIQKAWKAGPRYITPPRPLRPPQFNGNRQTKTDTEDNANNGKKGMGGKRAGRSPDKSFDDAMAEIRNMRERMKMQNIHISRQSQKMIDQVNKIFEDNLSSLP